MFLPEVFDTYNALSAFLNKVSFVSFLPNSATPRLLVGFIV